MQLFISPRVKMLMELTLQPIRRLIFRAGAKRVSDSGARKLAELMEARAARIAEESWKLAKHAGRTTVMKKDVRMAAKLGNKE